MNRTKCKLSAYLIILVLIATSIMVFISPTSAAARVSVGVAHAADYATYDISKNLEAFVDIDELKTVIGNGTYACSESIDISGFNIPYSTENVASLLQLIYKEMPLNFHFRSLNYYYSSTKITKIKPVYIYSASQYRNMLSEIDTVKSRLLADVKNNSNLNNAQKALLIHDRLALICEYDYNNTANKSDAYGALVNGKAVCEGYTMAYDLLLSEVGIESYYCGSNDLDHAWNIVYIDKKPYHVDVTWDDYSWGNGGVGVVGKVVHDNFLRSSTGIYSTGHKANDYDTLPCDITYDSYYWQDSSAAFQLINNKLYYIDNQTQELKCASDNTVLCSVKDEWRNQTTLWANNACLSSGNGKLYYSLTKNVYEYDLSTRTSSLAYASGLSAYNHIYGFEYRDGYFICDINDSAPYSAYGTANLYQIKYQYGEAVSAVSLNVKAKPSKTVYELGENLDTSGLTLKITYSNGTTETVSSGYTVSGFDSSSEGSKTVTVRYGSLTTSFTVTVKHTHNYTSTVTNQPQCTTQGTKTYTCSVCADSYTESIPATGHVYDSSCDRRCNVCSYIREVIHSYAPATCISPQTCTLCGKTNGGLGDHTYSNDCDTACDICNATREVNDHIYTDILDTTCNICSYQRAKHQGKTLVKISGVWTYVVDGEICKDNTLVKYNGKWYHVNGGVWVKDTTLVKYNGVWYYVKNGVKNSSNTLVKYNSKWYHVNGGKWVKDTTLVKYNGVWYYVKDGVKNSSNTLVKYNGKWYHVNGGKWVKDTTLVKYNGKWYYVNNGIVDFSYNGKVTYNQKTYTVKNGIKI